MTETQRILLANCNNNSSIHYYAHSSRIELAGGSCCEVVKLPTFETPTTASNALGKGLFVMGTQDNNW